MKHRKQKKSRAAGKPLRMAKANLGRNKKKTVFINPGSVGQPRNHSPLAQFSVLDTETGAVRMCRVVYDVKKERLAFSDDIDLFYQERLGIGV